MFVVIRFSFCLICFHQCTKTYFHLPFSYNEFSCLFFFFSSLFTFSCTFFHGLWVIEREHHFFSLPLTLAFSSFTISIHISAYTYEINNNFLFHLDCHNCCCCFCEYISKNFISMENESSIHYIRIWLYQLPMIDRYHIFTNAEERFSLSLSVLYIFFLCNSQSVSVKLKCYPVALSLPIHVSPFKLVFKIEFFFRIISFLFWNRCIYLWYWIRMNDRRWKNRIWNANKITEHWHN